MAKREREGLSFSDRPAKKGAQQFILNVVAEKSNRGVLGVIITEKPHEQALTFESVSSSNIEDARNEIRGKNDVLMLAVSSNVLQESSVGSLRAAKMKTTRKVDKHSKYLCYVFKQRVYLTIVSTTVSQSLPEKAFYCFECTGEELNRKMVGPGGCSILRFIWANNRPPVLLMRSAFMYDHDESLMEVSGPIPVDTQDYLNRMFLDNLCLCLQ